MGSGIPGYTADGTGDGHAVDGDDAVNMLVISPRGVLGLDLQTITVNMDWTVRDLVEAAEAAGVASGSMICLRGLI